MDQFPIENYAGINMKYILAFIRRRWRIIFLLVLLSILFYVYNPWRGVMTDDWNNYRLTIFHDFDRLYWVIIYYAEDHEGRIPHIDTSKPSKTLERMLMKYGYRIDEIRNLYNRGWSYYVVPEAVHKKISNLGPHQPLIKVHGKERYSQWWKDVSGRIHKGSVKMHDS